jgi:Holliday junction resolvase RusA-like endonuclease
MANTIQLFIPGLPVAQPRAKATIRGKHASVYNPKTADVWKAAIVSAIRPLMGDTLLGPVRCILNFTLPRPASHYGTGRNAHLLKPTAPDAHMKKPDADNLAKAVLDALSNAGTWRDDSQVCDLTVTKQYGPGSETGLNLTLTAAE